MSHVLEYRLSLLDRFTSTIGKFHSGMQRVTQKMEVFNKSSQMADKFRFSLDGSGKSIDGMRLKLTDLLSRRDAAFDTSKIRRFNSEIKTLQGEIGKLEGKPSGGLFSKLGSSPLGGMLKGAAVGLTAAAMLSYNTAALDTTAKFKGLEFSIEYTSKSAADFRKNIDFLQKDMVGKLKMPIEETYQGFQLLTGAMMGTKLQGQGTRDIFEGVAMGAKVLHLNADATNGVFVALSQMMSKGKVSAEEMNQQLGERLPGALNIAARAMGMSKAQLYNMMQNGKLMSEDFLPKFAAEMKKTFAKGSVDAVNTLQSKLIAFSNEKYELKLEWGKTFEVLNLGFMSLASKGMSILKGALIWVRQLFEDASNPATRFGGALVEVSQFMRALGVSILVAMPAIIGVTIWANLSSIAFGIWAIKYYAWLVAQNLVTAATWLFNAALWANPIVWVVGAILIFIAALTYLYLKFENVRGAIWGVWEVIKELGSIVADFFVGLFTGDWDTMRKSFQLGDRLSKAFTKGFNNGVNDFKTDKLQSKMNMLKAPSSNGKTDPYGSGVVPGTGPIQNNITSGGSRPTNITITLGKLMDKVEIHSTNLKEGTEDMTKVVTEALLRVLNSGNAVSAGGGL